MMINGFTPGFSSLSAMRGTSRNNRQQAPSAAYQQPQARPSYTPSTRSGWNLASIMGSTTSRFGQWAGSASQSLGSMFSNVRQSGSSFLSGIGHMPAMNGVQQTQTAQPVSRPAAPVGTRRTGQQILQSVTSGARDALRDVGRMATQNAPAVMTMGGAMSGACSVCAYMGGAMAATGAAILMNQNQGHAV